MKKGVIILALAFLTTWGAFAQNEAQTTWYNSYNPVVADNKLFVNAGIGTSIFTGVPISASVDFKLPVAVPITLGPLAYFSSWDTGGLKYRNIGFGVRGMYHFNIVYQIDTYAGLTLGYVLHSLEVDFGSYLGKEKSNDNYVLFGANIGARYYFTNFIGAYVEFGLNSSLQFASIGVTLKF